MYSPKVLAKKLASKHGVGVATEKAMARLIASSSVLEAMMIRFGGAALVDGSLDDDEEDYNSTVLFLTEDEMREVAAAWSLMAFWSLTVDCLEEKPKRRKRNASDD